ncbi:MAG: 3-deoxy-manno-octulosonate cytidylyltransferase, partial [Candidatus Omnitrophica bacterium]|nr:3-deoxy-manno-octulosonate cytidylyltransferase [Candidatus Omnitrophota bacterium]
TCRVIVNIQGDEPMIRHQMLDDLVQPFLEDRGVVMATLCHRIDDNSEINNPNVVKVVVANDGNALYFSRSPIPWADGSHCCYKHIGVYAYTKDFLLTWTNLTQSPLEKAERLEQLRVLENGYRIKVIETGFDTVSVDTEEDLKKMREILCQNISL